MVMVSGDGISTASEDGQIKGLLLGIGAAILYSSVVIINKKTVGIDVYCKTLVQLGVAAVSILPYVLITKSKSPFSLETKEFLLLLFVGIIHTGFAYAMYFGSMDGIKAQTIALFSYIDPVTAIIASAIVLKEIPDVFSVIGALLILGSTLFSEFNFTKKCKGSGNYGKT